MIKKSAAAALLITMGAYGLIYTNYSFESIALFAFGLLTICYLKFSLFTGMCGYVMANHNLKQVLVVGMLNLLFAYIFGIIISIGNEQIIINATTKVALWSLSFPYFIRSVLCGIIMFFTVDIYKNGSSAGIFLGIPLFILNSFQHCIANAAILGMARDIKHLPIIILCAIGNWCGGLLAWYLSHNNTK